MTDPLGQSQVLPYIFGLTKCAYEFHLISFEKMDRYRKSGNVIHDLCKKNNVNWHPQDYQLSGGIKTTMKQVRHMQKVVTYLNELHDFDIVHCRSYIAALAGLRLKRKFGTKFVFDMRGFWANERIDGNIWSLKNPVHKVIYRYFKRKEIQFFTESDYTISLTENGKNEIESWDVLKKKLPNIQVIPCCVNLDLFDPEKIKEEEKSRLRKSLGISSESYVLGYVGSIGTWYMLSEMLDYFKCLLEQNPKAVFFFVSAEEPKRILDEVIKKHIPTESIVVKPALHSEVPLHLSLFNSSIFFIRASYSKKASSPTKQGEIMAMGIPLICNAGVGDTDAVVIKYKAGTVISEFTPEAYRANLDVTTHFSREHSMAGALEYFSLDEGVARYESVYKKVFE